jgi:hypothetical protein
VLLLFARRKVGTSLHEVGSYLLYPVRVCLDGNEWLKEGLRKEAIPFDSLDNGFLWCNDPDRLQELADSVSGQPMCSRSSTTGSISCGREGRPLTRRKPQPPLPYTLARTIGS